MLPHLVTTGMILADQSALVLGNDQLRHESNEWPKCLNGLDHIIRSIASDMRRKSAPKLLSLLVQLLFSDKRRQITTCYSTTGQGPSLDSDIVIPTAVPKSGQRANTGWGYFKAAIDREEELPGKPCPSPFGIHSHAAAPQYCGESSFGSVDFTSFQVGECGQEEVSWPSKSLSTYLRSS